MPSNPKKKKALKRCALLLLSALCIALIFLPRILSFSIKKGWINHLSAKEVHLSWFGSQQAQEVTLFDHAGRLRYGCESVSTSTSLWDLVLWKVQSLFSKNTYPSFLKTSSLKGGYAVYDLFGADPVTFKDLNIQVDKGTSLHVEALANASWNQHMGTLSLEGLYSQNGLSAQLRLHDFPFLEPGDLINLLCLTEISEHKSSLHIEANAPHLNFFIDALAQNEMLFLQKPSCLKLSLSQASIHALYPYLPFLKNLTAEHIDKVNLTLNTLQIPLENQTPIWKKAEIQGDIQVQGARLESLYLNNLEVAVHSLNGAYNISAACNADTFSFSKAAFTWQDGITLDSPFTIRGPNNVQDSLTVTELSLPSLEKYQELILKGTSTFVFSGRPIAAEINVQSLKNITLDLTSSDLNGKILIETDSLILDLKSLPSSSFTTKIQAQNLYLSDKAEALITYQGKKQQALIDILASIGEGSIKAKASIRDFAVVPFLDFSDAHIKAQIQTTELPPSLCLPFIGNIQSLNATLDSTVHGQSFDISCAADMASIKGSFIASGDLLTLGNTPLEIKLHLKDLVPSVEWSNSPLLKLSLAKLSLPLLFKNRLPTHVPNWKQALFSGEALIPTSQFREKKEKNLVTLEETTSTFSHDIDEGPFLLNFKALVMAGSQKGSLTCTATVHEIDKSLDMLLQLNAFPSSVLDIAARSFSITQDAPFSSLFGTLCTGSFKAAVHKAEGPILCTLSSPLAHMSLSGELVSGKLILQKPFYAQCTMTPELSTFLLSEVNPLSISSITSEHPISLTIDPEGFSFPIFPFNIQELSIPNLHLELGQITCHNEGNVSITLGLLKSAQANQKSLHLWFAPAICHIAKGTVNLERTEILIADTYDVALWGTLDLFKERVDMILGLTADCLKKSFGIKNLPKDYVLHIPMKGPMDNVQINTGKATSKIALLLAWQQKALAGALGGGPAGALFGELLDTMKLLPDYDQKAPPAKTPFPWEKEGKRTSHSTHKKPIRPQDKPLKQLLKALR